MSATHDSTLSDARRSKSDLQRELAELRRTLDERTAERDARTQERDEALRRETATAEVLGVINASPGDLAPVFNTMLARATQLCDASCGNLFTYDGECFHTVAAHGDTRLIELLDQVGAFRPGSHIARLLKDEPFLCINDATKEDRYRRYIAVPLRKDDLLLGFIAVYRLEGHPFTEKQIALLQNFAAQAVIAMENARLVTETREALEQQTATAEVLQVINSSPGDLAPVFDAILEKAHSLCGATFGSLQTYDGEFFRSVAARGLPAAFVEMVRQPFRPDPDSFEDLVVRGEDFVHVPDVRPLGPLPDNPISRAAVEMVGLRTVLLLPLRKETALVGYIAAARSVVQPFTDREIALLQNFAAQAVIAIDNARLINETREALEQQTATAEVLGVINSSLGDLTPVFDAIVEKAMRLCDAANGVLRTFDGDLFHLVSAYGEPDAVKRLRELGPIHPRSFFWGPIARGEPVVHITDMRNTDVYRQEAARERIDIFGIRTWMAVPLTKDGAVVGAIAVFRKDVRPFSDSQIGLLQNFAAQAVIAMENARLITETREALEQQTATAEVLQVINSSPGDLQPVFDVLLDRAMHLCGVDHAALELYDGERMHAAAVHGASDRFAQTLRGGYRAIDHPAARALLEGQLFVEIADAKQVDQVAFRTAAEVDGIGTVLFVALRRDGLLLGMIASARRQVRPFTDREIALLQNFAAQAVIAMENARLINETREALEQQTATAEVLGVINSSPGNLAPVFDAILEKAMHLCGAAFGELRARDGDSFRSAATRGVPPAFAEYRRNNAFVAEPGSLGAQILAGEQIVHVVDLKDEDVYRAGYRNRRALVDLGGARTALVASLRKDDAVLGFIIVYRQEVRPFSDKQIAVLQSFADQAVIAMENARLLGELRQRNDEIAGWNRELETRVAEQLAELERTGKLRRFLAPQLADLIIAQGDESILESHRREIVVVFCDIRGFTSFAERAEPEEVMALLRDYHAALGPIVARFEGTLDHYSGDGVMVFFNDPLPTPEPAKRAIEMAVAMREAAQQVLRVWRRHGHDLGFGVGISQGYATLGQIGFAERMDYTAIGTVTNLAARLCSEAKDGQILISRRVAIAVEEDAKLEEIGEVSLKGLSQAVAVYNVVQ